MNALQIIGQVVLAQLARWGHGALFFLDLLRATPSALRRFGLVVGQIHAIGNRSLVIIVASGLSVGFVLALQMQGLQLEIWNAVAAPVGMPKAQVQKLATLLAEIVRRPDIRQKILNQGWQVAGTSPEGLARRIAADTAAMSEVIQKNNIKPN